MSQVEAIAISKQNPAPAFLSWVIVFLFPLYSLPWVVYRMCNLEKSAFAQFAFFMGLVGMLYPPAGDLYNYYKIYGLFQGLDWSNFIFYALIDFDYFLSFLLYFLSSVGLPCDLSRFLFNFMGFLLAGDLFVHILNNHKLRHSKSFRIQALIVFFVFSFTGYLYRSSLASIFFAYGTYYIVYENRKRYWFFVAVSVLIHFSYVFFALILLLSKLFPLVFRRKYWYIFFSALFLFGVFNVGVSLNIGGLTGPIFERYKAYLDPDDMGQYAKSLSWKNLIWQRFGYFTSIILLFFFIRFRRMGSKSERSFVDYLLLLCIAACPFSVIFSRFVGPLSMMMKFFFISHFDGKRYMRKFMYSLLIMIIALDVMNIWARKRELSISDMSILTYSTSFHVLTHTYSDSWIDRNITTAGDIVKYAE